MLRSTHAADLRSSVSRIRAGLRRRLGAVLLLGMLPLAQPADATPAGGPAWQRRKCDLYRRAWDQALAHQGPTGLGPAFLEAHQRFLASRCTRRADVCARSPEEVRLADTMVMLSMNFGAASTLAPFYCRP